MTRLLTALLLILLAPLVRAEDVRTIGWADLVPEQFPLADPMQGLDMWVRFDLGFVAKVLADADAGRISQDSSEYGMAQQIMQSLDADGLDSRRLVRAMAEHDSAIAQRKSVVNEQIDGQMARLPGYALPLSAAEDGVREFLLVPYVGACIHYPPPPPNQIVRAELSRPYQFEGRFQAVWITGRLSARPASRALDYVDGQTTVETGYTMRVTSVTPYAEDPSAATVLGSFSETADAPKLRLSRTELPHPPLPPVTGTQ